MFKKKLASSGLTLEDARTLGFKPLAPQQLKQLLPKAAAVNAFQIPYHDADGRRRSDVWRVRLLEEPVGAFGETPVKPLRYLQGPDSPPGAYLAKGIPWRDVFKDPTIDLLITEGELKAACACKHGFKCIGLGGVSSWRSTRLGWSLLPELAEVDWRRRGVVVVFDSDATTNPQVAGAIAALTVELSRRGALPRVAQLTAVDGLAKTGLDDLLVAHGSEVLRACLDAAENDDLSRELWKFNERFGVILYPGFIYDDELKQRYPAREFASTLFANVWAAHLTMPSEGGEPKLKQTQVAPAWVDWPHRRQYKTITYAPGRPRVLEDTSLNEWTGYAVEPKKGDIKPWTRLLDHLLYGLDEESRRWLEAWFYYPLAVPGTKLFSAVNIWAVDQGVGKSLIGETLGAVYGKNYGLISQRELESDFNGWLVNKQLVMIDDLSEHDSRAKADVLKKLITQRTAQVNVKYLPTYEVPDCCNFYITSNRCAALYVEEGDRRFFVHETKVAPLSSDFYHRYATWLREGGGAGAAALLYHACNVDLSWFKPHAPPPITAAKTDMMTAAKNEFALWVSQLRDDPEERLKLGEYRIKRDVFTVHELLSVFDQKRRGPVVTPNVAHRALREHLPSACGGRSIRVSGLNERYFIVRNFDRWTAARPKDVVAHVEADLAAERGATGRRGGKF